LSRSWKGTSNYRKIAGELAAAADRDFERLALPLIKITWNDIIAPIPMSYLDRCGVDHIAWGNDEIKPKVVVQYKGFKVLEEELGDSQINQ
jgi:hypothetical protein